MLPCITKSKNVNSNSIVAEDKKVGRFHGILESMSGRLYIKKGSPFNSLSKTVRKFLI